MPTPMEEKITSGGIWKKMRWDLTGFEEIKALKEGKAEKRAF
jgi:hypothetical protein